MMPLPLLTPLPMPEPPLILVLKPVCSALLLPSPVVLTLVLCVAAGYQFSLLDVGGGFPGSTQATIDIKDIANVLNAALDEYFPVESGVRIIAEPGRYYVASCATLVVNVIGKRTIKATPNSEPQVRTGCGLLTHTSSLACSYRHSTISMTACTAP